MHYTPYGPAVYTPRDNDISAGATVSMPHVELKTPDTATGGMPMPPAQAQNVPEFQTSGQLPDPEQPVTSESLSALAATNLSQTADCPTAEDAPEPAPTATSLATSEGSNIAMPVPPNTGTDTTPEAHPLAALPEAEAEALAKSEASASSKYSTPRH